MKEKYYIVEVAVNGYNYEYDVQPTSYESKEAAVAALDGAEPHPHNNKEFVVMSESELDAYDAGTVPDTIPGCHKVLW